MERTTWLSSSVRRSKLPHRELAIAAGFAALLVVATLLPSAQLHAAQGDCSQPVSGGDNPTASDCLFVLRTAVGTQECSPECVCDVNGSSDTSATDALVCLKVAVGQGVRLNCRCGATPAGAELQVNSYTSLDQIQPAVAADAQGNFVVAWESDGSGGTDSDGYSIQARRFLATGEPAGTELQVNTFTTGQQRVADVAAHSDGSFVVAWESAASADDASASVRARRFDASGTAVGTEFQVNTYTTEGQGTASVATDPAGGGFVVVWQSYGSSDTDDSKFSIQGQRYDSAGDPAGTEFQVNTLTPDSQIWPAVAFRDDNGFVVVWTSLAGSGTDPDVNVRAQMFTPSGDRESTEFRLNSYTTGAQFNPAVASDGAGGFVVVWQSDGTATDSDSGIVARFAGPAGQLGSEFSVNSYTTGAQIDPRVIGLDGRFVVVWTSAGANGGDADLSIQGQLFGNDGIPIGTEFRVNSYTTAEQDLPDVASNGGGDFMVVWESTYSAGSDSNGASVQAQRFE